MSSPLGFHAALFDLDDTLYQVEDIRLHVEYMLKHLGFQDRETARRKCKQLYIEYGTTYAGLVAEGYALDPNHFHEFVHGSIDYENSLKPDPALQDFLLSIRLPKFVFTNADCLHTERCLCALGITNCFQGAVHFENMQEEARSSGTPHADCPVICKPHPLAYHLALCLIHRFNSSVPLPPAYPQPPASRPFQHYIFFDDSARNIPAALKLGMFSVLVRPAPAGDIQSSLSASNLLELREKLPELCHNPKLRLTEQAAGPALGGPSYETNHSTVLSTAALVSDPQPAAGATPLSPAAHSVPVFNSPAVASHQVQPSEQLEEDVLVHLASHELSNDECDSHYVSTDMGVHAANVDNGQTNNGANDHATNATNEHARQAANGHAANGANGHAATGAMHHEVVGEPAKTNRENGSARSSIMVCGGGVPAAAVLCSEGPPARPRGAGAASAEGTCCAFQQHACAPSIPVYLHHQSTALHACGSEGEHNTQLFDKASTFVTEVRESIQPHANAGDASVADGGVAQEGGRPWGCEVLGLDNMDLDSMHSRHVVHANSVQTAIEAEEAQWEDELLARELGRIVGCGARVHAVGAGGCVQAMQSNSAARCSTGPLRSCHSLWEVAAPCAAPTGRGAEDAAGDGGDAGGDVQSLPEALRRAARAGRHVWVQKRM